MEINKGNKKICEWLGDKVELRENSWWFIHHTGNLVYLCGSDKSLEEAWNIQLRICNYHKSYDWILPVVHKLYSSGLNYQNSNRLENCGLMAVNDVWKLVLNIISEK